MEQGNTISSRIDKEVPTSIQITALKLAGAGLPIPEEIQEQVLDQAERGKDVLKSLIDEANKGALHPGTSEYSLRENFLRFAAQIAFSRGENSQFACEARLERLREALYTSDSEEDVGFTE